MKKISIKERLILYFVVLSVISITIVSLFSIFEARKGITNRTFSQLILLRDLRREQILTFFESRTNELKSLASSGYMIDIAEFILNREGHSDTVSFLAKENKLLELVSDSGYCKSVYFISASGNTYSFNFIKTDQAFLPERAGINIDTSFLRSFTSFRKRPDHIIFEQAGSHDQVRVFIVVPVYSDRNIFSGVILSEILPGAIYRILYNKNPGTGMGKTGEAYLVGLDGLMRSPSRFVPDAMLRVPVKTEGFHEAVNGKEGVGIYNDYRGIKILGAYGSLEIGGVSRIILAEIDADEAMVPLMAIRNEILFLSLFIVLIIFIVAWVVAYGITRPLVRLKNAANFIALGNYDQQLEVGVNDEIGELTRAFNAMVKEIKSTTHDLRENEERLRHFYQATLDGIILHENGRMIIFNSAMLHLTGYSAEELSGFQVFDILQLKTGINCDKDSEPRTFESLLIRKDRTNLAVEVQESCVDYEGKNIRASVIRDISARKKMETELAEERNKRIRAVIDGQDSERQRLSRELHDGLGQQLVAGKLILESSLYSEEAQLKAKISEAQHIFDQIIGDIRRISHNLSPSILQEFGLKAAMENLCHNIVNTTGILVTLMIDLPDENPDEMTSTYLFRIAQEGLNNVQRHSGATTVKVILKADQLGILLEIEDNGCGFQVKDVLKRGGNGLYNIRERVNILKGNLSIQSSRGKGTKILVRVLFRQ